VLASLSCSSNLVAIPFNKDWVSSVDLCFTSSASLGRESTVPKVEFHKMKRVQNRVRPETKSRGVIVDERDWAMVIKWRWASIWAGLFLHHLIMEVRPISPTYLKIWVAVPVVAKLFFSGWWMVVKMVLCWFRNTVSWERGEQVQHPYCSFQKRWKMRERERETPTRKKTLCDKARGTQPTHFLPQHTIRQPARFNEAK
jgi:hypothetical protein